jgi:Ca2+-binding EF-hand superfamily protein
VLLLLAALASSCATTRRPGPPIAPPAEAAPESRPAFAHFLERYDRDRDGRIARAEYSRTDEGFRNLDRDRDGIITAADLAQPVHMPADLAAPFLIVRRFAGPDVDSIAIGDLDEAFEAADLDRDGSMDRVEFSGPDAPPGPDRFAPLLAAADRNHDARLTLEELKTYALARDRDGDGRLARRERMMPGVEPRTGWFDPPDRQRAPDFTLPRDDAAGRVTLSAFAGKRPVALIFGSYT